MDEPRPHAHLVSRGLELDPGTRPDHDEGVQEVGLDAGGREGRVVRLQEHDADDVVPDVAFPLQLWEGEGGRGRKGFSACGCSYSYFISFHFL